VVDLEPISESVLDFIRHPEPLRKPIRIARISAGSAARFGLSGKNMAQYRRYGAENSRFNANPANG
jgi:hypothetical protein